ncbi:hypothetical protein [Micromonospora coxensis]|uniref:Uncharacterized protein n=1 Tax=Micromonospora coxensis TaxID=356852 RepID=A0A1C5GZF2_9ACTN|nr:hypothetical protein [Micromonospora coxensis]SCG39156.1 hypothetical protein GA0070614_0603 [Micromonospora coxensis]
MTLQVETRYLYGYAGQLEANKDDALVSLEQYCRQHCLDFDGLDGTLYPARWGMERLADSMLDACGSAKQGLWLTAYDLRNAAKAYDAADVSSAEQLWTAGRAWSMPAGYREVDVAACDAFSQGASVALPAPPFKSEVGQVKDAVYQLFGTVNDWVARLTGFDLLEKLIPVTLGDSGAVRRVGAAWGEMEHGLLAVAADIDRGMDVLSTHWNSELCGTEGASGAFDYHIRKRWKPAFEAVAQACDAGQQLYELLATEYEYTVNALLFALNFYSTRLKKAMKVFTTTTDWKKFLWNLWQIVSTVWQLIVDAYDLLAKQTMAFKEGIEMLVANIVTFRNMMRGDFDALKTL